MPHKTANPWTVLLTRPVYENPWIRVVEHDVLNPAGKPGIYGVVHIRSIATGVVPVDEEGCVTLVGQYRFPLGVYSWELPEGGSKPGEDPLEAVQRELLEETGLTAGQWLPLLTMHLSNCITDEAAHLFLAWDLAEGIARPDDDEALRIRRVPFAEAYAMACSGAITDAISVAAILRCRLMALEGELPEEVGRFLRG